MLIFSTVPPKLTIQVISDEHGIDPTGTYHGDSDLQLERINVYDCGFLDRIYCVEGTSSESIRIDLFISDS